MLAGLLAPYDMASVIACWGELPHLRQPSTHSVLRWLVPLRTHVLLTLAPSDGENCKPGRVRKNFLVSSSYPSFFLEFGVRSGGLLRTDFPELHQEVSPFLGQLLYPRL